MPLQERTGMYRVCEVIAKSYASATLNIATIGQENLPPQGGYVVCANHISYADPFAVGAALLRLRAYPYFLAKESLFRWPVTGAMITKAEQIPVYRASEKAGLAYQKAIDAIQAGKVVLIFPEGTISRDDQLWPMTAKTGAARISLATGMPVVPAATWGGQRSLPAYGRGQRKLFPRAPVTVRFGKPLYPDRVVDQSDEVGQAKAYTAQIMASITRELAQLRQESPPEVQGGPTGTSGQETV